MKFSAVTASVNSVLAHLISFWTALQRFACGIAAEKADAKASMTVDEKTFKKAFKKTIKKAILFAALATLVNLIAVSAFCSQAFSQSDAASPSVQKGFHRQDPAEVFRQAAKDLDLQTEFEKSAPQTKLPKFNFDLSWKALAIPGAVLLALIIFSLVKHYHRRKIRKTKVEQEPGQTSLDPAALAKIQKQADELADDGLYIEAMHSLLLSTIEELKNQMNSSLPSSLTSREIVNNLGLSPGPAENMSRIVEKVELCWFGNFIPKKEDYLQCRSLFDKFKAALTALPKSNHKLSAAEVATASR
ncbi:MAG: hypothetical protein LBT62_08645 [Deltaproteobacteria bacterium]|nr:hypothetical protein [Deltaproteobacteria bacterium]